jgi:hypothetical protein
MKPNTAEDDLEQTVTEETRQEAAREQDEGGWELVCAGEHVDLRSQISDCRSIEDR